MNDTIDELPWRFSLDLLTDQVPEIPTLSEQLTLPESVFLFSGREGSMKTWLGLDWIHAIAKGNWQSEINGSFRVYSPIGHVSRHNGAEQIEKRDIFVNEEILEWPDVS